MSAALPQLADRQAAQLPVYAQACLAGVSASQCSACNQASVLTAVECEARLPSGLFCDLHPYDTCNLQAPMLVLQACGSMVQM